MLPLVYHPHYSYPFPHSHRFPMAKFGLLFEHLSDNQIVSKHNTWRPGRCPERWLSQAHCSEYIDRFVSNQLSEKELRRLGLPWSQGLVRRTLLSPSGTLLTAQLALEHGIACHLAGGTHHAHFDFASGFCIFNDLALAATMLLKQANINRVLIFDCDVHQGDGTARILTHEPNAITVSLHCGKNFPTRKAISDLDIELPVGTEDDRYLQAVSETLTHCLSRYQPDIVLYDAGVDVYHADPLGLMKISLAGIKKRDSQVLARCVEAGIPVATVIGGGYDKDQKALAKRHAIVIEEAHRIQLSRGASQSDIVRSPASGGQ